MDPVLSQLLDRAYQEFEQAVNAGGKVDTLAALQQLRKQGPLVWGTGSRFGALEIPPVFRIDGMRTALVMDYDGVTQVLKEDGFRHAFYPPLGGDTLIHLNGEPHRRFRQLLTAVFAPRAIAHWEMEVVPGVTGTLLRRLDGKVRANLVGDFCRPYPAMVFRAIMGLPEEDTDRVRALAILQIAAGSDERLRVFIDETGEYLQRFITERRMLPADELASRRDLVSLLVGARDGGAGFTDDEIRATLHLLITAGVDTTNHGLANTLFMILTRRGTDADGDHFRVRPRGTGRRRALFHEGLRRARRRVLDRDDGGGTPAVFENPDALDVDRANKKTHVSFGASTHICPGMHLARLELPIALGEFLDRFDSIRWDPASTKAVTRGMGTRSPSHLNVILG